MTRAFAALMCGALVSVGLASVGARAQAPGDDPVTDPAADPASTAPVTAPSDREAACRALLEAADPLAAQACFRALADDVAQPEDVRARARATVALVEAWSTGAPARLEPALDAPSDKVSVTALVSDSIEAGLAEGVVASAVLGAVGVTTATSAVLAKARTDSVTSTPLLLLAPALGGAVGAATGYGVIQALGPTPGDVALATSASTLGFVAAVPLQLVLFSESTAVSDIPLRFVTVLGGGAAGALAGGAAATFLDVTQGDVALAHSASLWSTVVMSIALSYRGGDVVDSVVPFEAALLVPYVVVIAAHEHVEINRFATWLIEAGGVSGLLLGGAAAIVAQPSDVRPYFIAGTVAGVGAGLVAAWLADDVLDQARDERPDDGARDGGAP